MEQVAKERLRQLLEREEADIDLAEAALLLSAQEYPALDVDAYLQRLDALARKVHARLANPADAWGVITVLNRVLFQEEGFAGNSSDYYDPRNSLLNEVLERKLGIPITLSIIYIEVARRLGMILHGVSFPGHFLVKLMIETGEIVLDPYAGGAALSAEDLQDRLTMMDEARGGVTIGIAPQLIAAGKKEILVRLLRNLKAIYLGHQQLDKALTALDRILLITPELAEEWRDRGLIYRRLECFRPALIDLKNYLRLAPDAPDADEMRAYVIDLQGVAERLN